MSVAQSLPAVVQTDYRVVGLSISVVVPTYYRPVELSRLLDSMLEQTRKPMEIVVVDDTPIPSIELICKQYERNFQEIGVHLFYVKNPKERSITSARNLGAKMAKGDIVQFFDSDLIPDPDYFRGVQDAFEEHPEVLGVAGRLVWNRPPDSCWSKRKCEANNTKAILPFPLYPHKP